MRRLLLACLALVLLLTAGSATAQPYPENPDGSRGTINWAYSFNTVSIDGRYLMRCHVPVRGKRTCKVTGLAPRTVHLYGDSIMKGWGFGHYDDPSPLGRIDQIASMLARANGAGVVRFRRTMEQAPARICADVHAGVVRRGDRIVFEDAGPRETSGLARQRWLEQVVRCANRHPSRVGLSTMFDYDPDPVSVPNSTYDVPLDDGRTANEITRAVARKHRAGLLDFNALMDAAVAALPELRLVHDDGIHPTVFGNVVMAAAILRHEGVRVRNVAPLVEELMAQQSRLTAWAPVFDRAQAERWVRVLVG